MSLMTTGLPLEAELSDSGTEMMTPLPVPIHNRCKLIIIDVMRTKEKPNLPVPLVASTEKVPLNFSIKKKIDDLNEVYRAF